MKGGGKVGRKIAELFGFPPEEFGEKPWNEILMLILKKIFPTVEKWLANEEKPDETSITQNGEILEVLTAAEEKEKQRVESEQIKNAQKRSETIAETFDHMKQKLKTLDEDLNHTQKLKKLIDIILLEQCKDKELIKNVESFIPNNDFIIKYILSDLSDLSDEEFHDPEESPKKYDEMENKLFKLFMFLKGMDDLKNAQNEEKKEEKTLAQNEEALTQNEETLECAQAHLILDCVKFGVDLHPRME